MFALLFVCVFLGVSQAQEMTSISTVDFTSTLDWSSNGDVSTHVTFDANGATFSVSPTSDPPYYGTIVSQEPATGSLTAVIDTSGLIGSLPVSPSGDFWDQITVAVTIMQVYGETWTTICCLAVFVDTDNLLKGYLEWSSTSGWNFDQQIFNLPQSGFHEVTMGFSINKQISIWIDGISVHNKTITHKDKFGKSPNCGILDMASGITGASGSFIIKSCSLMVPVVTDLYVSTTTGSDSNDGLTLGTALKTISAAASKAIPGCTIHVADGTYRESVSVSSGEPGKEITYIASGPNVFMLGSIAATSLTWIPNTKGLGDSVIQADTASLGYWKDSPRFMTYVGASLSSATNFERYHIARDPNYHVESYNKFTEFWEVAEGGSSIPTCNPAVDGSSCDESTRSPTQLIDSTFNKYTDLVGARIFISDCNSGHYIYKRNITSRNTGTSSIVVDSPCMFDGLYPTLGLYGSWYVENKLEFMDTAGEYFYDNETGILYFNNSMGVSMSAVEISNPATPIGFDLTGVSNVRVSGFNFMFYEDYAIYEGGGWSVYSTSSLHVQITDCNIFYCNEGVSVAHGCDGDDWVAEDWTINNLEVGFIDKHGLNLYNPASPFPRVGLKNFTISNSYFHDLAFNCDDENRVGLSIVNPKYIYFLDNKISRVSHNAVQFSYSTSSGGVVSTGQVFVRGNTWDSPCCSNADCGCLKFWSESDSHIWKDVLVTENVCQNSFGWTRPSWERKLWDGRGYGGFGWYTDHVAGVTFYRNVAYNVADLGITMYLYWEDADNYVYNNLIIGSLNSYSLGGKQVSMTANTNIKNNVFLDSENWAFAPAAATGLIEEAHTLLDNNLYWHCGWNKTQWKPGIVVVQDASGWNPYPTFSDLHADFPSWEVTALEFDPGYGVYDSTYNLPIEEVYKIRQYNRTAFEVTSALIDAGTATIPSAISDLLSLFGVCDPKYGSNYDLGPYEYDPTYKCSPSSGSSTPGSVVLSTSVSSSDSSPYTSLSDSVTTSNSGLGSTSTPTSGSDSTHSTVTSTSTSHSHSGSDSDSNSRSTSLGSHPQSSSLLHSTSTSNVLSRSTSHSTSDSESTTTSHSHSHSHSHSTSTSTSTAESASGPASTPTSTSHSNSHSTSTSTPASHSTPQSSSGSSSEPESTVTSLSISVSATNHPYYFTLPAIVALLMLLP